MRIKKLLTPILAAAIVVGTVSGCSTAKPGSSTNDAKATIDIFQFKVEIKDAFEAACKQYTSEHPNITINVETVGGGQDYGAALKAKFNSGSTPAIYNIGGITDVTTWKPHLADVSDTKAAKTALKGSLDQVTADGKVYGLPFDLEGYGYIYNKSVFKKAGIDPKTLTSFDAMMSAVKTLDSKKSDLGLSAVFALPAKETWVTGLHMLNAFMSPEFNGDVQKTYAAKTIDFKYADAMKKVLDMQNQYSIQPTASLDYSSQVDKYFATGKVAMIQQGNWAFPSIKSDDADFANNNIGLLPYPVPGYKEDCYPVGVPNFWAVNSDKDAATKKAAKAFLDWLYTSDEGKKIVTQKFNFIAAYSGYDASLVSDPLSKQLLEASTSGKTYNWVFMAFPDGWGMNKVGADVQLYVQNKLSWDQLVTNAKNSWADARK